MLFWFFVIVGFNDNAGGAKFAVPLSQADYEM